MAGSNGVKYILDLNGERILACAASESGVEIRAVWPLPAGTADRILLSGDLGGQEFAAACAAAGAPKMPGMAVVMPAKLEIVRSVTLPASAPGEIEGMVRFEAGERLPWPQDTWRWTYRQAEGRGDGADIVIHAVRKDAVRNCMEMFRDSGMKLLKIYPWSACAAPFLKSDEAGRAALIVPDERDISLALSEGNMVRLTRVLPRRDAGRLPVELETALDDFSGEGEVRLMLLGNSIEKKTLDEIGAGLHGEPSRMEWEDLTAAGIRNETGETLPLAAAVGASAARMVFSGNGADLIPRATREETAARRKKFAAGAAAALMMLGMGAATLSVISGNKRYNNEIKMAEAEIKALAPRIETMNSVRARIEALEMSGSGISALDMLARVSAVVPQDTVKITRFFYEKGSSVGLSGQAETHEDVMKLIAGMEDSGSFRDTHLDFSREVEDFSRRVVNFEISSVPAGDETDGGAE